MPFINFPLDGQIPMTELLITLYFPSRNKCHLHCLSSSEKNDNFMLIFYCEKGYDMSIFAPKRETEEIYEG